MARPHSIFAWGNLEPLMGLPYGHNAIQDLFAQAKLDPDQLVRDRRVGIDSMPPHEQQPATQREIDLSPSYQVRLRFKRADLVSGAQVDSDQVLVLFSVIYLLVAPQPDQRYQGGLPYGIEGEDTMDQVIQRVGRTPTTRKLVPQDTYAYCVWEDRSPVLHVLFETQTGRMLKVTVFLAPHGSDSPDSEE